MEYVKGLRGSIGTPIRVRLERYFERTDGCWEWTGYKNSVGYGMIGSGGNKSRPLMAHRVAYEIYVGPVPAGMELHHVCQNKGCVNPEHLTPITRAEHSLQPGHVQYEREAKTHCPQGHPWAEYRVEWKGGRRCSECSRISARRYHARKREARCRP
jgi:hypothetical protein